MGKFLVRGHMEYHEVERRREV